MQVILASLLGGFAVMGAVIGWNQLQLALREKRKSKAKKRAGWGLGLCGFAVVLLTAAVALAIQWAVQFSHDSSFYGDFLEFSEKVSTVSSTQPQGELKDEINKQIESYNNALKEAKICYINNNGNGFTYFNEKVLQLEEIKPLA